MAEKPTKETNKKKKESIKHFSALSEGKYDLVCMNSATVLLLR
jgi:hypothetical protein